MNHKIIKASIDKSVYVAPGAAIAGDVRIEKDCTVWFHATVRGDREPVIIGEGSNVQDNAVIHVENGYPVTIGKHVVIGHGAIVHGCEIGDNTLIGMGAIILNGAKIGKNCIIGAGALVTQNTVIPDDSLAVGSPAKVRREVTELEKEEHLKNAADYVLHGKKYKDGLFQ